MQADSGPKQLSANPRKLSWLVEPPFRIFFMELDLADLSSVRRVAEIIDGSVAVIYLLFNNAGVMAVKDYTKPEDVYEVL